MGQLILADNLAPIVKASTTSLTLADSFLGQPARAQVGGQSYRIPSGGLTLNTGTTGANGLDSGSLAAIELWYVYLIVNQTTYVPALIASKTSPTTGPGTMPSGYGTAYKLVGAFYTNGSSEVGSAVPIVGAAETEWMSWFSTLTNLSGYSNLNFSWQRHADSLNINATFTAGAGDAAVATLSLPFSFDTATYRAGTVAVGLWFRDTVGSATNSGTILIDESTSTSVFYIGGRLVDSASSPLAKRNGNTFAASEVISIIASGIKIANWKNTLL